jgi:flagellar protein FlgJ
MVALSIPSMINSVAGALGKGDALHQKAKKTSQDFESVFLSQILNTMSEGLGQDTGFDGGSAETQWRTLMNEYTAKNIAQQGGIGLSRDVYDTMLKMQGA